MGRTSGTGSGRASSSGASYPTRRVTRGDGVKRVKYTFDPFHDYDFLNDDDHYDLYGRRRGRQQEQQRAGYRASTREHLRRGGDPTSSFRNPRLDAADPGNRTVGGVYRRTSDGDNARRLTRSTRRVVSSESDMVVTSTAASKKRHASEEDTSDITRDADDDDDNSDSMSEIDDGDDEGGDLHRIEESATQNASTKTVRFNGKEIAQSDFTVTDPEDSDELINYDRHPSTLSGSHFNNSLDDKEEQRDMIIGGKSLRVTKARKKYSEEYSDYEEEYASSRYQPRLRQRRSVDYSKQLMPANFTQILERESKVLDRIIDASAEDRKSSRDFFVKSSRYRPSSSAGPSHLGKSPRLHERLNESDDEEVPIIKRGRIFGLLQASSMANTKNQILPVNMKDMMQAEELRLLERVDSESRAQFLNRNNGDTLPLNATSAMIGFEDVSGFDDHIMSLKEMVGLPLMYPSIFAKFNISPPKGVLFHGPPGTGKTMMARALANSCSTTGRPVAFFMRKGADILSKWVGESERQLRLLFEQAKAWQPSIIFFDEIDGLAPVRSSKQDQIHASVVSTLLSLMDGLDNRGQVVVIGATNRIDSIDPALRRPGRFDREFFFGLPKEAARRKIIHLATKNWIPSLSPQELDSLAVMTRGYNGADCKALCTEAALHSVRRTYPQIYSGKEKMKLNLEAIQVNLEDFVDIMTNLAPSTERSSLSFGRSLPQHLAPLLKKPYELLSSWILKVIPLLKQTQRVKSAPVLDNLLNCSDGDINQNFAAPLWIQDYLKSFCPRLAIYGLPSMGQDLLGSAMVEMLEQSGYYVRSIDISSLVSAETTTDSLVLAAFCELKRHRQAALYLPNLHAWWDSAPVSTKEVFLSLLEQTRHASLMVIMTMEWEADEIPYEISSFFPDLRSKDVLRRKKFGDWKFAIGLAAPDEECRQNFFTNLLKDFMRPNRTAVARTVLSDQASPEFLSFDEKEKTEDEPFFDSDQLQDLLKEYETHRRKLRQVFSAILEELRKGYKVFTKPLDANAFPDYEPAEHVDLLIMEDRVHANRYELPQDFMKEIDLICSNVLEGTNARIPSHREMIAKARKLVDSANENIQMLTNEFLQQCWYFFLFKRSGLLPRSASSSLSEEDNDEEEIEKADSERQDHGYDGQTSALVDTMSKNNERESLVVIDSAEEGGQEEENSTVKEKADGPMDDDESVSSSDVASSIVEATQFTPPSNNHESYIPDRSAVANQAEAVFMDDNFDEPIQPLQCVQRQVPSTPSPALYQQQEQHCRHPTQSLIINPPDLSSDGISAFANEAASKTSGMSLFELEDFAAVLASFCLSSGKLDLEALRRLLN